MNLLELLHQCQNGEVSCARARTIIEEYIEKSIKEKSCENNMVCVPIDPPTELLHSMAMRYDHSFGLPHGLTDEEIEEGRKNKDDFSSYLMCAQALTTREKVVILTDMKRFHEEIVGRGFYKYKHENLLKE